MSHIALSRGLKVLHHLVQHGSARFKDLSELLDPVSPASLMRLLQTLIDLGEVEKAGNLYELSPNSFLSVASSNDPFAIKSDDEARLGEILRGLARECSCSTALFGWVSPGTMVIMNSYTPVGSEVRYRPAGQEWPLVPFHDYSRLFLAYAPDFYQEDAFFRWNHYLSDEYKVSDFNGFTERLSRIRDKGYTLSEEAATTFGSLVMPVFLHEEKIPRFALGMLINKGPAEGKLEGMLDALSREANAMSEILRDNITPKQIEFDIATLQKVVRYTDPHYE